MKFKELAIILMCLVIPLIFSIFLKMNFFVTLFASLSISVLGLYLLKKNKFAGKLLAAASTLGIFMAIGNTMYSILNSIIMITIMYFYVTTDKIDDVLFKVIVLLATITVVGMWNSKKTIEGLYVAPLKKVSSSLTQRGCQDYCENSIDCNYAVTTKSGRGNCSITHGLNQIAFNNFIFGINNINKSVQNVWRNKNFVRIQGSSSGTYRTPNARRTYNKVMIEKKNLNMIPKMVRLEAEIGDQNWGNRTRGVYIIGYKGKSQVFNKSLLAPRTSGYRKVAEEWSVNTSNKRIDRIEVKAYSRGWGHAIRAKNANFIVTGSQ